MIFLKSHWKAFFRRWIPFLLARAFLHETNIGYIMRYKPNDSRICEMFGKQIDEASPFQEKLHQLNEHSSDFLLLGKKEKIEIFSWKCYTYVSD